MGRKKKEEPVIKIGQRVVVDIQGFLGEEHPDFEPEAATTYLPSERAYVCKVSYRPRTECNSPKDRVVIVPTDKVPVIGLNILKRIGDVADHEGNRFDRFIVDEGEEE
jgi:hypothetical protein